MRITTHVVEEIRGFTQYLVIISHLDEDTFMATKVYGEYRPNNDGESLILGPATHYLLDCIENRDICSKFYILVREPE